MKNEKSIYCIPMLEVVRFPLQDVLATSGVTTHGWDGDDHNDEPGQSSEVNVEELFPSSGQ